MIKTIRNRNQEGLYEMVTETVKYVAYADEPDCRTRVILKVREVLIKNIIVILSNILYLLVLISNN